MSFLTAYSKMLREKTIILDPTPKNKTLPEEEEGLSERETIVGRPIPKTLKKSSGTSSNIPQLEIVGQEEEETSAEEIEDVPLNKIVENSLAESDEIASETLAELLTSQQQYKKALAMYERLILIFPEKSSFFAEKIKHLKKILS